MSFLGKKWVIKNEDPTQTTIEKLLANRNLQNNEENLSFHDPFLFVDMEKSIARIKTAIDNNEKIMVFGDYDVDGITAAAILVQALKKLNANIYYTLPNRHDDGYGLSTQFIDRFIKEKIDLIITVDCGISCSSQIDYANENNIETIITDHHTVPPRAPDAFSIIHPLQDSNYPFADLTGAGIALKLAQALIKKFPQNFDQKLEEELVSLAALGTVADLGVIKGENKHIVKKGLERLLTTESVGLQKIIEFCGLKDKENLDTFSIGFQIAPRINAAGRIGDPYIALDLLLQEQDNQDTHDLGQKLENLNFERREMTDLALIQAQKFFGQAELPYILVAENKDWHVGIIGLIAGRLTEKHGRPSVIMQDFGDELVGSCRSLKGFNVTEALADSKDFLINFGGHAQAAGFSLKKENLEKFKEKIQEYATGKLAHLDLKPTLEIDCSLNADDLTFDFLEEVEKMAPFGMGNEKPVFILKDIEPYFVDQVGKNKDHLKFSVKCNDKNLRVIAFNMGHFVNEVRQHRKINLACHLDKNIWKDKTNLQLQAVDISGEEK